MWILYALIYATIAWIMQVLFPESELWVILFGAGLALLLLGMVFWLFREQRENCREPEDEQPIESSPAGRDIFGDRYFEFFLTDGRVVPSIRDENPTDLP
jgi:hypothetical protein